MEDPREPTPEQIEEKRKSIDFPKDEIALMQEKKHKQHSPEQTLEEGKKDIKVPKD